MVTPRMPNSFIVTCLEPNACKVYFEPFGSEYDLEPGDVLTVETLALQEGHVEVSYSTGAITLGFTSDHEIKLTNRSGENIRI